MLKRKIHEVISIRALTTPSYIGKVMQTASEDKNIIIITGLSGSGKSSAARNLEDLGFFCIDNIPVDLLPKLLDLTDYGQEQGKRLALVIDCRQRAFMPRYTQVLNELEEKGADLKIMFFDARDEVIIRRYSETRRQHPLAVKGVLLEGIREERRELEGIKQKAHWVIDTSDMTVHQLREEMEKIFSKPEGKTIKITINSFGFGKGVPLESDLVFDVRFLPNPYFVEELRNKDGLEAEVSEWVLSKKITGEFLKRFDDLLTFLTPLYIKEGKQYLTISIGCTGGKHRSVVVAQRAASVLKREGYIDLELRHREISGSC